MPVYTYHCDHCEAEFEKYQSFSEESLKICPECEHETLRKIYSPALVVFKGSGFYVTDTKSSSATLTSNNNKEHGSQDKSDGAEKKEDKKTEVKSEKKATSNEKEKK